MGIEVMACIGCANYCNITDELEKLGIKVIGVGEVISQLLKDGWASLTF